MNPKANNKEAYITHDLEASDAYSILNSIIVPRPIAFITTRGENGIINAAPFSYFNIVCTKPAIVSVSIERRQSIRKDTAHNIFTNKEYVINICSVDMAAAVSCASKDHPPEISEIDVTSLSLIASEKISVPRIANTLIQMECYLFQALEVGDLKGDLILGKVLKVHLHKEILNPNGQIDFKKLNPLARLSGNAYAKLDPFFNRD